MTITDTPVDNGVNTEALLGAREALTNAPEAAEFTWRATCSWVHGTYSRTTVDGFSGLGQDHQHRTTFVFDADHPECFASEDRGATPAEHVLGRARQLPHRRRRRGRPEPPDPAPLGHATVEGNMNVLGILGADPDVRNGFGDSTSASRSTPTPRRTTSRRSWPSRRSVRRCSTS